MCTSATSNIIAEVIASKISGDEMFTAYDISQAVQDLARKRNIPAERHREMKAETHEQMEMIVAGGIYKKTAIDVGAPVRPFLYHPSGMDPASYKPAAKQQTATQQTATQQPAKSAPAPQKSTSQLPSPLPPLPSLSSILPSPQAGVSRTAISNPAYTPQTTQTIGSNGKLCVPSDLVRAIGLKRSGSADAWIFRVGGKVYVRKSNTRPSGGDPVTSYVVDKSGNVRITRSVLTAAGLDGPDYLMKVADQEIEIC